MAPFRLKFRMGGSSRSTSQEQETDTQTTSSSNNAQPNYLSKSASNNFGSSTTIDSEQNVDSLCSMGNDQRALLPNNEDRIGYINPTLTHTETNTTIPLSPPPSYEHVLEENRLAALDKENNSVKTGSLLSFEMLSDNQSSDHSTSSGPKHQVSSNTRKQESIDSSLYTCSTATSPSQENLITCTGSCDPLCNLSTSEHLELVEEMDDMNIEETCLSIDSTNNQINRTCENFDNSILDECRELSSCDVQDMYQPYDMYRVDKESGQEIHYKSSKQLYKAVAKECGITCKMSDQCRCLDCQSRYFDCEYDHNENEKTDGGLGAGTPMFINEVMHGTACTIL